MNVITTRRSAAVNVLAALMLATAIIAGILIARLGHIGDSNASTPSTPAPRPHTTSTSAQAGLTVGTASQGGSIQIGVTVHGSGGSLGTTGH